MDQADGTLEMSVEGVGASSTVSMKKEDLANLWEATDDELYQRLQADKIVTQLTADIFAAADRDRDAKITCEEFVKFLKARPGLTNWWGFFEA